MSVKRIWLLLLAGIVLGVTMFCTACGDSTVHAAQTSTAAILTGSCDASSGNSAFMTGLGSTNSICGSATGSDNTGLPMPSAGLLANLHVSSPNTGAVVNVLINGQSSPITCTISGSGAFSPGSACSDTVHTANVSAGDLVAVKVTTSAQGLVQDTEVALEKQ
jgi:hypothetical protein